MEYKTTVCECETCMAHMRISQDWAENQDGDPVNHPAHYTTHPSGIEAIRITEHENFCRGNALKYILRAGKKGSEIEDLKKAAWYINREIERLESCQTNRLTTYNKRSIIKP